MPQQHIVQFTITAIVNDEGWDKIMEDPTEYDKIRTALSSVVHEYDSEALVTVDGKRDV